MPEAVVEEGGEHLPLLTVGEDRVHALWSRGRFFELPLLRHVASMHLPGTYVDAGANHGNHAVYFSRYTDCTRLVAVEPQPDVAACLDVNLRRHARCRHDVVRAALGHEAADEVRLGGALRENSGSARVLSAGNPRNPGPLAAGGQSCTAPMKTLDGLVAELGLESVALVKMDVEGYEAMVVMGGTDTLLRHAPALVVELASEALFQAFKDAVAWMGYRPVQRFGPGMPTYLWTR